MLLASFDDSAPSREPITLADLHRQDDPSADARERHGALLAPQMRMRHGPPEVVGSPGPFVASSPVEAFTYREAKTGKTVVPGPRKVAP